MKVLLFGFKYWKKRAPLALLVQIISFVAIVADLCLPMLTEIIMDYIVLSKHDPSEATGIFKFLLNGKYGDVQTLELFMNVAMIFMGILLVRVILIYIKNVSKQKLGLSLETELRELTYDKLMKLDSDTISEYNTGELLQTINSDTIMFKQMFCDVIPNIFDSVFILVIVMALLFGINKSLLIIPLVLMPFLAISLLIFRKKAKANFKKIRECNSNMSLTVQENIEAVRLVRSFTNEDVEMNKFHKANDSLRSSHINQIKVQTKFEVIFSIIRQIAYIGTIAISSMLVIKGQLNIGYLIVCTVYVTRIMDHITQINNILFMMQQQLVAGQMMYDFMRAESKVPDNGTIGKVEAKPSIKITDASLVLADRQVLKNINLDIPYGKKLGVVGGTGSGKSILLESLVRVHDMTDGKIEINGKEVSEYTLKSLRNVYSYVFQDVFLFSNTIDSNIAYSKPDIEPEKVYEAARLAQAHNFIEGLVDGYDTIVGERGLGISGGQKQRVSIARALLKNADVLIFDDSTSALDVETERKLLEDVKSHYPDKTIIISAHRMTSVVDCDEIIYLQDGEIVERGTFEELMALNGHFADVYNVQRAQRKEVVDFDAIAQA